MEFGHRLGIGIGEQYRDTIPVIQLALERHHNALFGTDKRIVHDELLHLVLYNPSFPVKVVDRNTVNVQLLPTKEGLGNDCHVPGYTEILMLVVVHHPVCQQ